MNFLRAEFREILASYFRPVLVVFAVARRVVEHGFSDRAPRNSRKLPAGR
jgi:hypothetical protein